MFRHILGSELKPEYAAQANKNLKKPRHRSAIFSGLQRNDLVSGKCIVCGRTALSALGFGLVRKTRGRRGYLWTCLEPP